MSAVDSRTVTVKEAISRVTRAIKANRPLFLWGPPGVGKSELCQDFHQHHLTFTSFKITIVLNHLGLPSCAIRQTL